MIKKFQIRRCFRCLAADLVIFVAIAARGESFIGSGPWSGAVTPTSAVVKARITLPSAAPRLAVSTSADFRNARFFEAEPAFSPGSLVKSFSATNLIPNTAYHYALEIGGALEREKAGEFRTFREGPASFSFAFGSCARTGSTNGVFETIRRHGPLFFMNTGDLHYLNIDRNDRSLFRAAYETVLQSSTQGNLYRHVPFVYVWDDHDFGPNDSDRNASGREASRLTYQEYVPHYPLAAGRGNVPIYQAFTVGRARFILTDLRSERDRAERGDTPRKSMMGGAQKKWFKRELLAANGKYPLIFWVSSVPWIRTKGVRIYPNPKPAPKSSPLRSPKGEDLRGRDERMRRETEDSWAGYTTERHELADFIKTNHIRGLCILSGDAHMLAADDGTNSDYATGGGAPIPVLQAAPLDNKSSAKGGPYTQGVYRCYEGEGCFGLVKVHDERKEIRVTFSGRNARDEEKISLKFTVSGE
jgi:alkaline phosphatase D